MKDENNIEEMSGFLNTPFDKKLEIEFFKELASMETVLPYLRMTLEQDLKRHFYSESPMAQFQVKGAFSRTNHIMKGVIAAKSIGKKKDITPEKRRMK